MKSEEISAIQSLSYIFTVFSAISQYSTLQTLHLNYI